MSRFALRHRYGRATKWKRPSEAELFAHGKPLAVKKDGRKWTVFYLGHPIVRGPKGLTFYGRPDYVEGLATARLDKKDDAVHVAHMIGRYALGFGDLVFAYTEGVS